MVFKAKNPKKGTKITVKFDAEENKKIERMKHPLECNSKEETVKKMVRKFPEEKKK